MEIILENEMKKLSPLEKKYFVEIKIPFQVKELFWEYGGG